MKNRHLLKMPCELIAEHGKWGKCLIKARNTPWFSSIRIADAKAEGRQHPSHKPSAEVCFIRHIEFIIAVLERTLASFVPFKSPTELPKLPVIPIIKERHKPTILVRKMPGQGGRIRLPSLGTESNSSAAAQLQKEHHRIVMMGSAKVGKSSIISQFLYDKYLSRYKETVEELHRGEYELDGASLTLDILDTSGAFQFPAMRALSISTADAFILVFAVDDGDTWEEVKNLREQIINARGYKVPIVIVGNKIDVEDEERQIIRELAETIVRFDWQCGYVECSAKNNENIIDVFKELLVQAKIRYNLSPAVRRRRQSLPNYMSTASAKSKHMLKRNSCSVA